MTRRLYFGNNGGQKVFRISKPGYDAKTDATANMLLDSSKSKFQIIVQGRAFLNQIETVVPLPVDCTGCKLLIYNFNAVRTPSGPSEFIRFTSVITASALTFTITLAGTNNTDTYMPPNFVNWNRWCDYMILKE